MHLYPLHLHLHNEYSRSHIAQYGSLGNRGREEPTNISHAEIANGGKGLRNQLKDTLAGLEKVTTICDAAWENLEVAATNAW